ncbi:protein-glutamate O-methyltransferase CheR [Yoonia sp. BS5-3]|uniref:Chemotaxis protein methyltransferase n=1 Tax=Yoonia phaeophyticola TaxID=3137369 RepID=A0ABZ2V260_9RHOB
MNEPTVIRPHETDLELRQVDFDAIAEIAHREFGLSLSPSKRQLVQSRLSRRVRALGLANFADYRSLLEGPNRGTEQTELLSALTTNVTKFFREIHHFERLRDDIMPDLVLRARKGERIRIWSAGCSSGQEPYSIALTALKCDPNIGATDFKILATDIDPAVLSKAQAALYRDEEIEGVPQSLFRPQDISHNPDGKSGEFTVSSDVRSLITFGVINLISKLPFSGGFNVIFCRNVAIYFDRRTQQEVWRKFANLLPEGGSLFIGHSERINKSDNADLETDGITIYRKLNAI